MAKKARTTTTTKTETKSVSNVAKLEKAPRKVTRRQSRQADTVTNDQPDPHVPVLHTQPENKRGQRVADIMAGSIGIEVPDNFIPLTPAELLACGCVHELWTAAAEWMEDTGQSGPLRVCPNGAYLVRQVHANYANRERTAGHVALIASVMQRDYRPEITRQVLSWLGANTDGGHGGLGLLEACCPSDVIAQLGVAYAAPGEEFFKRYDVEKDDYKDSIIGVDPCRTFKSADTPENWKTPGALIEIVRDASDPVPAADPLDWTMAEIIDEIDFRLDQFFCLEDDDAPKKGKAYKSDRWVNVIPNVGTDSVRHFDVVLRTRQGAEQLQQLPPLRAWMTDNGLDPKTAERLAKLGFLCFTPQDEEEKFGNAKGGGNVNKTLFPAFLLSNINHVYDWMHGIEIQNSGPWVETKTKDVDEEGDETVVTEYVLPFPSISQGAIDAAYFRLGDRTAIERLAKSIANYPDADKATSKQLAALNSRLAKLAKDGGRPDQVILQAELVAIAQGRAIDFRKAAKSPEHQVAGRGVGFDQNDEEDGESWLDSLVSAAETVDAFYGSDDTVGGVKSSRKLGGNLRRGYRKSTK